MGSYMCSEIRNALNKAASSREPVCDCVLIKVGPTVWRMHGSVSCGREVGLEAASRSACCVVGMAAVSREGWRC